MNVCMRLFQLECLLTWAVLTAVNNAIGNKLSGDARMDIEKRILSNYILWESTDIVPNEIRVKIVRKHIVMGCIFGAIFTVGLIQKVAH